MKDKPFALIGINGNEHDPKKLKATMEEKQLNWRSFAAQDAINAQWNEPGTPTYYVIDPTGTIRYKWVGYPGEKAIDTALETLLEEAEKNAKKLPK